MAVIRVPKTPMSSFDKNRPASELLKRQVEHLEWAVRNASERKPDQMKKHLRKVPRMTEAQAAARIEQLTRQLHPAGAANGPAAADAASPAAPNRTRKKSSAKARRPGRRASR